MEKKNCHTGYTRPVEGTYHFFYKVAYSRYDMQSEMFDTCTQKVPNIVANIASFIFVVYLTTPQHLALISENMNTYRAVLGKPEGKRPLGRLRSRWEVWIGFICLSIGTNGGFS
jgi:hypothetical protein